MSNLRFVCVFLALEVSLYDRWEPDLTIAALTSLAKPTGVCFRRGLTGVMAMNRQAEEFSRALAEGAWLLRTNQPQAAVDKLLPLYEQAPSNVDVAINLGGAYILLAKWNKAVRVLSKAAELHADNPMVWTNLAAAYLGRLELAGPQQQQRAIRAYERALEIDPATPNVHYHLGLIYKERGDLLTAIARFENALVVNPNDKDAQFWIERLSAYLAANRDASGATQASNDMPGDGDKEVI